MLVSCPPYRYPCYYGIDFPTQGEFITSEHSIDGTRNFFYLDSFRFLSLPGMLETTDLQGERSFCLACFNGTYPVQPEHGFSKLHLES
jgi:amidophosphoribosyltransferase